MNVLMSLRFRFLMASTLAPRPNFTFKASTLHLRQLVSDMNTFPICRGPGQDDRLLPKLFFVSFSVFQHSSLRFFSICSGNFRADLRFVKKNYTTRFSDQKFYTLEETA